MIMTSTNSSPALLNRSRSVRDTRWRIHHMRAWTKYVACFLDNLVPQSDDFFNLRIFTIYEVYVRDVGKSWLFPNLSGQRPIGKEI